MTRNKVCDCPRAISTGKSGPKLSQTEPADIGLGQSIMRGKTKIFQNK